MIPGIHNLETVGSSPLKRGMKIEDHARLQKILLDRDFSQIKSNSS